MVEFNIFYLKEEHIMLQETGTDIPMSDWLLKKMTFLNIDNFVTRTSSPEYTIITSGGDEFICNENYETVTLKIRNAQQAMLFKLN